MEQTGNTGNSSEDIRELKRQQRRRLEAQGYPERYIDFLLNYQGFKAGFFTFIQAHDTKIEKFEAYRADEKMSKYKCMQGYTREERLELAHELSKMVEMDPLRLFLPDEAAAMKSQMSVDNRTVFITEEKGRVLWKK